MVKKMKSKEAVLELIKLLKKYNPQFVNEDIELLTIRGYPLDRIIKDLKAFEIIKEKRVDVYYFMSCETLKEYNEDALSHYGIYDVDADQRMLTQEEFDLLKEVLL